MNDLIEGLQNLNNMNIKMLRLFTLLLMTSIFFVACNEEDISELPTTPEVTTPSISVNQLSGLNLDDEDNQGDPVDLEGCYEIVPPISFIMEDGSTVEVATEEDFIALFDSEPYPVDVAFPVNLEDLATGDVISAANEEELTEYIEGCEFTGGGSEICDSLIVTGGLPCYDFDFPISFVLVDGTTVTADSEDDLDEIFVNGEEIVDFAFPLNLINTETGEAVTAEDAEELDELFEDCFGEWPGEPGDGSEICDSLLISGDLPCYDFEFPISFELADGSTVTADSEDDLEDIFIQGGEIVDFVYPLNLIDVETGDALSAADADELEDLFEDCFDGGWNPGGDFEIVFENPCFSFVYPISITTDGEVTVINSIDELSEAVLLSQGNVDIVYPYDVTVSATGEVTTVETEDDLFEIFENCEG